MSLGCATASSWSTALTPASRRFLHPSAVTLQQPERGTTKWANNLRRGDEGVAHGSIGGRMEGWTYALHAGGGKAGAQIRQQKGK